MVNPLSALLGSDERILVGPQSADDAGVYLLDGRGLIATADFITPVCDDPRRFGRVAAANSLSDVFAMGGRVLFALNLCCFPEAEEHRETFTEILAGAAEKLREAGGVLLGGHSVRDAELKFGLAVVGEADPARLLTNAGARPGQRLILTKPLGTGVLANAFKVGKLDEAGLEPALVEMERLNDRASRLALEHGATAATDVTGFALVGHALGMARASGVGVRVEFARLPVHDGLLRAGQARDLHRLHRRQPGRGGGRVHRPRRPRPGADRGALRPPDLRRSADRRARRGGRAAARRAAGERPPGGRDRRGDPRTAPLRGDMSDSPRSSPDDSDAVVERLERQIEFIVEIDKLKTVLRRTTLIDRSRHENSAEHSWHIALMAVLLSEHAKEEVNLLRVVKMLLVHDLVEIDAGDTFCYDAAANLDKEERERAAAARLFALLPPDQGAELWALWEEFEAMATPEARYAAALDRMQPILHNLRDRGGVVAEARHPQGAGAGAQPPDRRRRAGAVGVHLAAGRGGGEAGDPGRVIGSPPHTPDPSPSLKGGEGRPCPRAAIGFRVRVRGQRAASAHQVAAAAVAATAARRSARTARRRLRAGRGGSGRGGSGRGALAKRSARPAFSAASISASPRGTRVSGRGRRDRRCRRRCGGAGCPARRRSSLISTGRRGRRFT